MKKLKALIKKLLEPKIVDKLPETTKKGKKYKLLVIGRNGPRLTTFKATGKKGFGKWIITKNEAV